MDAEMTTNTDAGADAGRRQKMRSIAIALTLGFMAVLFYAATIVRLGSDVLNRPI